MILDHLSPSFKKIHLNHKILDEWCINHSNKKIFLCTTKCASRSMIECLSKVDDYKIVEDPEVTLEDILSFKDYQFYAIVRNPKNRYISGLNFFINYFSKGSVTEKNKNQIETLLSKEYFIFDEHTLPQSFLLSKVTKHYNINLIKLEGDLDKKISESLDINVTIPIINSYKSEKTNFIEFCNEMYEKYCFNNINFTNLYKKDYNLYNRGY